MCNLNRKQLEDSERIRKEKVRRQQDAPSINQGKGDSLAQSAMSRLHRLKDNY